MRSFLEKMENINEWLEDVLAEEHGDVLNNEVDFDLENDNLEPEDPHALDVLAAKCARELEKDPNYLPSTEVWAEHNVV